MMNICGTMRGKRKEQKKKEKVFGKFELVYILNAQKTKQRRNNTNVNK